VTAAAAPGAAPDDPLAPTPGAAALLAAARALTPARVFVGRTGTSYRTADLLALRADHAAARDAVDAALDLDGPALARLTERYGLFAVDSAAPDRATYLRRPDLGRRLSAAGRAAVETRCAPGADLQVVVDDGLSARAVEAQVPSLLPALLDAAREAGWSVGQTFVVRQCRVGVLNDVGAILDAAAVVLLIGERPGLATARSLSAYLAWRPGPGHTDADRNLVSNIHERGTPALDAVTRIIRLVAAMRDAGTSGYTIKEMEPPPALP
jgi:ethanolamine ammonia-lyase small subunit